MTRRVLITSSTSQPSNSQRFGPSTDDYDAVIQFAHAKNLTVTGTHPNRMVLDVSGTVAEIEKAFHVTMRTYPHPIEARNFYAPDTEPIVDAALPILRISGLDNYAIPRPKSRLRSVDAMMNVLPKDGSGPSGSYDGSDFRAAYAPGVSLTGAGQVVG